MWLVLAAPSLADVHLVRRADGSAVIFNDIGSGWTVNGKAPTDNYLISRRGAPTPFDDTIRLHAGRGGIDPKLVKSVMLVESNYNPRAVSRKGACGLMQLMPGTARLYGVKNTFDAEDNIRGGVAYLSNLLTLYQGNVTLALAAYNAGEGAVEKYSGIPPYPETQEYVRRAMVAYRGTPTLDPIVGGGFRGMETSPAIAAPRRTRPEKGSVLVSSSPVKLQRIDGAAYLTNVAGSRPSTPILGRVDR